MTVDLVIRGRAVVGRAVVKACIVVDNGVIKCVKGPAHNVAADKVIDFLGNDSIVVMPGIVDLHVHLRDLRQSYKEDYRSGTSAAAAGGVTTVADMPNTDPETCSEGVLLEKVRRALSDAVVNVCFYLGNPRKLDTELVRRRHLGVVGVKLYPRDYRVVDDELLSKLSLLAQQTLVVAHAEDPKIVEECEAIVRDPRKHHMARPKRAEVTAAYYLSAMLYTLGARAHLTHASTSETVHAAKAFGLTVDTCPHYLLLTSKHCERVGPLLKVNPPLRDPWTVAKLRQLASTVIDCFSSDHAPHALCEKESDEPPPGIPGVQYALPALITLAREGYLTLVDICEKYSRIPALILGLYRKGCIAEGFDADITVVDLREEPWDTVFSKAGYNPYKVAGVKLRGRVLYTVVGGVLVFEKGVVISRFCAVCRSGASL